jgi:uncharacterized repeat protein (TIGR03803 family)
MKTQRLHLHGIWVLVAIGLSLTSAAQAQTFQVIYTFNAYGQGGYVPEGVTLDAAGHLFGTTLNGGAYGAGTVYQMKRSGSNWLFQPIHSFARGSDGSAPLARVVFGPDGSLFGTTTNGGNDGCDGVGCGTVFKLSPSATACRTALCPWAETVLYAFLASGDGIEPGSGDLVFDRAGNIYGTTQSGGSSGAGTVYELTPVGGGWTERVLWSFAGLDGAWPVAGVVFDGAGNLYGTTFVGGAGYGVVFQLTPSGSGWTENVLYTFHNGNDGREPFGGVIFDPSSGNLYGATSGAGQWGGGTIFELSPSSGGGWTYSVLYSFTGGGGPTTALSTDGAGNIYGTTEFDGAYGNGNVFKLTNTGSGWTYQSLHDFTGGADGQRADSIVAFDGAGNLYGTTAYGGSGYGVVWEITP